MAQGQAEEGLDQMRQSLTAYEAAVAAVWQPYFLALLAEEYGRVGATDEGLRVLAKALAGVEKTGERVWEAELHRLTGELLLQQAVSDTSQAETCLHRALAVARHQQARSLELRAATSLARLRQQQGKQAEACALLTPIYRWFTEGFETADLQEAKVLLNALEAWAGRTTKGQKSMALVGVQSRAGETTVDGCSGLRYCAINVGYTTG